MFVCDTSAYINGQRDHYRLKVFPSVWDRIGEAIDSATIIVPRAVYTELESGDDEVFAWIKRWKARVVEPGEAVQRRAGVLAAEFPKPGVRNGADPFVLAEAERRGYRVVTYEGRTFSGRPTRKWHRSMPGICDHFNIGCITLAEALEELRVAL